MMAKKVLDLSPAFGWPFKDIERVDTEVSKVARSIRLYYYRNLSLLRQIPYLALEADGRGGWSDGLSRIYNHCMLSIHENRGLYDMFIELRTGVLISAKLSSDDYPVTLQNTVNFSGQNWNVASDREIYAFLVHGVVSDYFNPAEFIHELQEKIKKPYHNDSLTVESELRSKAGNKEKLDKMMTAMSEQKVKKMLKDQGFGDV